MKPLKSIKVLDLTNGIPYIGSMFADYGAELIKVEPLSGDKIRSRGRTEDGSPYENYYMRAKESLAIDYKTEDGSEIIRMLAKDCDMFVASESEASLSLCGLSYEDLKKMNPRLIYGILTPYGEIGPWKNEPDYDFLVMSKTGLQDNTGFPEKPTKFGFPLGYFYSSWHLTAGMLAAYLRMLNTGEGCKVSTNTWQVVASLDDTYAECYFALNTLPKRIGNGFPTTNPTDTFKCKNGWFSLSIGSDDQWISFANVVGNKVWAEDPRYAHDPKRSMENYFGDLDNQLREYFLTITIEEADRICREALVPGGPCNTIQELINDPQVADRKMIITVGSEKQLGKAAKFSRDNEEDDIIEVAHEFSIDTIKYLKKIGYSDEKIKELQDNKVIL